MADAELEQEQQTKRPPCSGLRKELKDCIISSDCVIKVFFKGLHYLKERKLLCSLYVKF